MIAVSAFAATAGLICRGSLGCLGHRFQLWFPRSAQTVAGTTGQTFVPQLPLMPCISSSTCYLSEQTGTYILELLRMKSSMPTVYLVGVSHGYQIRFFKTISKGGLLDADIPTAIRFEKYLEQLVCRLAPQVICEEYSNSQLNGHLKIDAEAYSISQRISERRNLQHIFCDPDEAERAELYALYGTTAEIDKQNGFPAREGEWLTRLACLVAKTSILFVCGACHVATFGQRLRTQRFCVNVVCEDFELI